MDGGKKISFGFNKTNKKPTIIRSKPVEQEKIELVDCVEGQSIKIKDAIEVINQPLVIPTKENKNFFEGKTKRKEPIKNSTKQENDDTPDSELTLEELAARELLNDAKNRLSNTVSTNKFVVLPLKEEKTTLYLEPTLDDYENIPINDYGMAMLRGMGFKEATRSAAINVPELRPTGLGLGANKMIKAELPKDTASDKDGNELILKKGAFAKIIAGSHKGNYCEVQGLDDEAGRVIVRTSLKAEVLTLHEFLIVPVTKEEFSKGSKILNNAKYEEYKEISDKKLENFQRTKREPDDRYSMEKTTRETSSSRKFNVNHHNLQGDEENSKYSEYSDKEQNERYSEKNNYRSRNEKYDSTNKYDNDTYKVCRSRSHRDDRRDSSDSDSDKERKDKEKKKHHNDSSRSREDKYKGDKKFSKSKHRNRSSSSDYDEKEMNRKNKSKHGSRRHDSEREGTSYRKNRR